MKISINSSRKKVCISWKIVNLYHTPGLKVLLLESNSLRI